MARWFFVEVAEAGVLEPGWYTLHDLGENEGYNLRSKDQSLCSDPANLHEKLPVLPWFLNIIELLKKCQ